MIGPVPGYRSLRADALAHDHQLAAAYADGLRTAGAAGEASWRSVSWAWEGATFTPSSPFYGPSSFSPSQLME